MDDEDDARVFLSTVLEDAGATVFEAADGDQAIALARKEKPDLITLDLSMPGKDGVEVFGSCAVDPEPRRCRSAWSPGTRSSAR